MRQHAAVVASLVAEFHADWLSGSELVVWRSRRIAAIVRRGSDGQALVMTF